MKKLKLLFLMQLFTLYTFAQTFTINHNGTAREYILHLPTGYTATNKYPLVMSFHGLTSNAGQQQMLSGLDAVSNTNQFIVVYPNGLNNSWNAGVNNGNIDDVGFVSTLMDALIAKYPIDAQRVYATGFSMGGYFSYRLACKLSNRIAAIAPVSGLMAYSTTSGCSAVRPVPVAHFHGTSDPIVDFNGVAGSINFWKNQDHCTAAAQVSQVASNVELTVYGGCSASSEVRLYKINGGGHTYPRASSSINASLVMWDFFKRFTLSSTPAAGTGAPTVSITSPANNATFAAASSMNITADAADANGSVAKVEFYLGATKVGEDIALPYTFTLNNLTHGSYILTAKATDNSGAVTVSAPINIVVSSIPVTSPCAALPAYIINGNYTEGSLVKNRNHQYECKSARRCNGSKWAYAPGTGAFWQYAWTIKGTCPTLRIAEAEIEDASINTALSVFPNPVEDKLTLKFISPEFTEVNISILNMLSEGVYHETVNAGEGLNTMELDVTKLRPGLHIVMIKFLDETRTQRIFVK